MMPVLKVTRTPPMKYSAAVELSTYIHTHTHTHTTLSDPSSQHTERSGKVLKQRVRPMEHLLRHKSVQSAIAVVASQSTYRLISHRPLLKSVLLNHTTQAKNHTNKAASSFALI